MLSCWHRCASCKAALPVQLCSRSRQSLGHIPHLPAAVCFTSLMLLLLLTEAMHATTRLLPPCSCWPTRTKSPLSKA